MTALQIIIRALAVGVALSPFAVAANAADPSPADIPVGHHDYRLAPAGTYTLDPNHVGVIARVSHLGFSISIFRFGKVAATLDWNPNDVAKSKLNATVDTASIESNVPGFAEELQGDQYLKAKAYPTATFVSTAFRKTDAQHGKVDGTFTLMGKSVPLTFDVSLIGAGPAFTGTPVMSHVIGIHAEGAIHPHDFGMSPFFTMPIQLVIDTEFDKVGK